MFNLYAYNNGSKGAKLLAAALGIKLLSHVNSKFKGDANKDVINWGASTLPDEVSKCTVYNANSWIASNKLHSFERIKGKPYCPAFWTTREEALKAMQEARTHKTIVCRTILNGHSGNGIIIAEKPEELVDAPLYVRYIPKKDEYRIHVMFGKVIHIQRKARKKELADDKINWKIRNHNNGFIFQQDGFVCPDSVKEAAIDAVDALELDFGAVDVVFNEKLAKPYVLEVNTAPGIEGTTVEKYAQCLKESFVYED